MSRTPLVNLSLRRPCKLFSWPIQSVTLPQLLCMIATPIWPLAPACRPHGKEIIDLCCMPSTQHESMC